MDLFEAIDKRRTIRDFTDEEVDDATIKKIIDAAFKAPANDHMRDWEYIVVTDRDVVVELLDGIPKKITESDLKKLFENWNLQDLQQQECYRNAVPKQYRMLAEASAVIIPLYKRKTDIMHPKSISDLNPLVSMWCCVENMYLAATALDLGLTLRVPLGKEAEHAREVLGYPSDYDMPCFIGIGHPKKDAKVVVQREIDIEERTHWDRW